MGEVLRSCRGVYESVDDFPGRFLKADQRVDEAKIAGIVEEDVVARCADICDSQEIVAEEVAVLGLETERVKVGSDLGIGGTCNGFDIGLLKDDA